MRTLALGLIKFYRYFISPLLGPCCRFYPSCSQYAELALQQHGFVKGSALTLWRLLRCNPWNAGGVDHVPGTCDCCEHHNHSPTAQASSSTSEPASSTQHRTAI